MAASRKQLRKVCFCPEHKLRLKTSKKVCFAELKNVSFLPKYQRICTAERGKSDVEQKSWALKKSVQAKKTRFSGFVCFQTQRVKTNSEAVSLDYSTGMCLKGICWALGKHMLQTLFQ
jgi:hypothetical protein